jgi:ribonucleotide monophosphatase NagD (HAD superfamily)
VSYWDTLDPKYRLILCDIWGVVHDGVHLYPGAAERLKQWRDQGRCVVLLTNAPRTAEAVEQQLARIGLPRDGYDFVATSGEAGIQALLALGETVGFVGTAGDREILEGRGLASPRRRSSPILRARARKKHGPIPSNIASISSDGSSVTFTCTA